jgi:hypothetical protein
MRKLDRINTKKQLISFIKILNLNILILITLFIYNLSFQ